MTKLRDERFQGVFTAIATPFTEGARGIDDDALARRIRAQADAGVDGIVIAGTTGESPTLSGEEYRELADTCIHLARDHGLISVLGTGSNSTAHAAELQKFAAEAGADATLSVNPYYNKPTQEGLFRHFEAVAKAADIPVILYNIPGRTGVALAPEILQRLAPLPNIVAVKESTGSTDSASRMAAACPDIALFSGDDPMTLPFAAVGAVGVVSVLSNIIPERIVALCRAFRGDRWDEALRIHRELLPLSAAAFAETNPIPLKAAMKLLGTDTGELRLPMTPASGQTVAALREALTGLDLL